MTADFHRYGVDIEAGTTTVYLDDVALGSIVTAKLGDGAIPQFRILFDLAMGSGWPVNPPPAGYYDMWIDGVRYWH